LFPCKFGFENSLESEAVILLARVSKARMGWREGMVRQEDDPDGFSRMSEQELIAELSRLANEVGLNVTLSVDGQRDVGQRGGMQNQSSVLPKPLEAIVGQLRVAHRMLDVLVPEVVL
jgi:hypothetical protein